MELLIIIVVAVIAIYIIHKLSSGSSSSADESPTRYSGASQSTYNNRSGSQPVNGANNDHQSFIDATHEFFEELPKMTGKAMAGDMDTASLGMALYAVVTGPTGLASKFANGKQDWAGALDIVDTAVDAISKQLGPYASWNSENKDIFGFTLAYFYFMQASGRYWSGLGRRALSESIPHALEINDASPTLKSAIRQFQAELRTEIS